MSNDLKSGGNVLQHTEIQHFQGPYPPPQIIEEYQKLGILSSVMSISEDANKRQNKIVDVRIKLTEAEIENTKEGIRLDAQLQNSQINMSWFGMVFISLLILSGLAVTFYFACAEKILWATVFGLPSLCGVISAFYKYMAIPNHRKSK